MSVSGAVNPNKDEENEVDYTIYDNGERQFILRVVEMKHNVAESVANGSMNISIPKAALYNQMIFTREIPNESKFGQFYDTAYEHSKSKAPSYNLVNDQPTEVSPSRPKITLARRNYSYNRLQQLQI